MKKIANSLMALAALVLFGTCLVTVFDLVEVLPEIEHTHNFCGPANFRHDSIRRNFARAAKQTRGRRRITRYQA
jgi:hypothetical protein